MAEINFLAEPKDEELQNLILDASFSPKAAARLLGYIATNYLETCRPIPSRLAQPIAKAFIVIAKQGERNNLSLAGSTLSRKLGLNVGTTPKKQSLIRVYKWFENYQSEFETSETKAIAETSKHFGMGKTTVRDYIKEYRAVTRL